MSSKVPHSYIQGLSSMSTSRRSSVADSHRRPEQVASRSAPQERSICDPGERRCSWNLPLIEWVDHETESRGDHKDTTGLPGSGYLRLGDGDGTHPTICGREKASGVR